MQDGTPPKVRLTPEEFEALYGRAMEFLRQGLALRAAHALAGLAQLHPDESRVYRGLGLACHHLQQYGVAFLAYGAALQLAPSDLCAQALRAECSMFVLPVAEARVLLQQVATSQAQTVAEARAIRRVTLLLDRLPMGVQGAIA